MRALVDEALARGWGDDPDGGRTAWRLVDVRPVARPPGGAATTRERLLRS